MSIVRTLIVSAVALGSIDLAGAASAQEVHIQVGDLSQPAQRTAFDRRVDQASVAFCGTRSDHLGARTGYRNCVSAIREEAMSQLSAVSRAQYAAVAAVRVASVDH